MINILAIKKILKAMYPLLIKGEDHRWAPSIRNWYSQIDSHPEEVIREILHCSSCHSSLSDTVIMKDLKLLIEEDTAFCALHDELFQLCVDSLPEISKAKKPQEPDLS